MLCRVGVNYDNDLSHQAKGAFLKSGFLVGRNEHALMFIFLT